MAERPSRKTFRIRLDEMVSEIRNDIISGRRQIGDFLPSERTLGEMFRLSNKSVRAGLDILVQEGLIEKIPKVGNRVKGLPDDKAIPVRFGYYTTLVGEADMANLISSFHKEYPHIRVTPIPIASGESVQHYLEAGLLDVCTLNYNDFRLLADNGGLDLLEGMPANPDIYGYLTNAFTRGGQVLVQPFVFSPVVLCYNRQHFRERRIHEPDSSWTWDHLQRVATELAVPNVRLGFYFYAGSNNRWPVFLLQSGMSLPGSDEARNVSVCGSPWMDGLALCKRLITSQRIYQVFDSEADAEELFAQGKTSIIMTTYFRLNELKKADIDYDIAPLPHFRNPKTLLHAIGLSLNVKSKQKDAARQFIDFLLSFRSQLLIRQRTLSIPSLIQAAEWTGKEIMRRPSRFHLYREIVPTFCWYTDLGMSLFTMQSVLREAKLYWAGLETEVSVCRKIEQIVNARNAVN